MGIGAVCAFRADPQVQWEEACLIDRCPAHPSSFIAVLTSGEYSEIDLDSLEYALDFGQQQEGVEDRALWMLRAAGDATGTSFEEGPLGRPPTIEEVTIWREQLTRDSPFRWGSMRGGAKRHREKKPDPSIPRVSIPPPGLSLLGAQLGGGAPLLPYRDLPDNENKETTQWIVAWPSDGLSVGDTWLPSAQALLGAEFGVDTYNGHEIVLKAMGGESQLEARKSIEGVWSRLTNDVTPRGPEPSVIDSRILPLDFDDRGGRNLDVQNYFRNFMPAIFDDWPLDGPRTVQWVLKFVKAQTGGNLGSRVQQFMALAKLNYQDGSMAEYNVIAKAVDLALSWDGVSIGNCASFELLLRRFQLIEEKFRHRLPQASGTNIMDPEADSSLYLGLGMNSSYGKNMICMMPALSAFVGDELSKEAAISKGKVKAHQLRAEMQKLSKEKGKREGE